MELGWSWIFVVVFYLSSHLPYGQGQHDERAVVVDPVLGSIAGTVETTVPFGSPAKTRSYFSFSGIPYADPDSYTGAKRFMKSELWDKTLAPIVDGRFIANDSSIRCPQTDVFNNSDTTDLTVVLKLWFKRKRDEAFAMPSALGGDEKCLHLNVHTPKIPKNPNNQSELLPVIVFIHGGSWAGLWGGIFGGERFLTKDVIFVTLNYRLGILGSLNLGIDQAPGNGAMYDILNGLKWVKQHIKYFGGNADQVTVSGQSAGAMLATHLLTTKLIFDEVDNKPLIHGLIALSGSSLSPLATCTDPITHHLKLSELAGCHNPNSSANFLNIRNCMAGKTPENLNAAMIEFSNAGRREGRFGMEPRVPSVQNPAITIPIFMSETPYQVLEKSEELDIPVMMGTTRHDGGFLLEDTYLQYLEPNNYTNDPLFLRNHLLPTLMEGLGLEDPSGEMYHSLAKTYLGEAVYKDDFQSKIPGLLDIHSVFIFKAPAYQLVEMHSKKSPSSSYYFSFDHNGYWSLDGGSVTPGGVGHVDSLFYLFKAYQLVDTTDFDVSNRFIDYWTDFAIYSNPNGNTMKKTVAPYNPINHPYLVIKGVFDWTNYYCRDSWLDNSQELIAQPPPTRGTRPPPESTTGDSGGGVKGSIQVQTLLTSCALLLILTAYH